MKYAYKRNAFLKDYLVLTSTVLISLSFLFFGNDNKKTAGLHQFALEFVGNISAPLTAVQNLIRASSENSQLRRENAALRLQNSQLSEFAEENKRLRDLIGFKESLQLHGLAAKVVGISRNGSVQSIMLNLGGHSSIKKNMAVINSQGLVGKIVNVSPNFSTCELLLDRNFSVAAIIQRSRTEGIYQSRGEENGQLLGPNFRSDIQVDDTLITSGMNSLFPSGLKIGTVAEIEQEKITTFKKITVRPAVNFEALEEVYIITSPLSENQ
jgi:rod shape-determining protein MreC